MQAKADADSQRVIHRGEILHMLADPADHPDASEFIQDGALVVADGYIESVGQAEDVIQTLPANTPVIHHRNALITPGFIDCHVHYPQYQIIASYGEQLLDWLNKHTYPEEMKFSDLDYASQVASKFLDELLSNGTTTTPSVSPTTMSPLLTCLSATVTISPALPGPFRAGESGATPDAKHGSPALQIPSISLTQPSVTIATTPAFSAILNTRSPITAVAI